MLLYTVTTSVSFLQLNETIMANAYTGQVGVDKPDDSPSFRAEAR